MDSRAGPGALSSLVVIRVYLSFFFPLSFLSSSLWLCQVLVATHGISSCCMRTLSRDVWDLVSPDQAPCIGSAVSQPLDRQERSQHPCSLITTLLLKKCLPETELRNLEMIHVKGKNMFLFPSRRDGSQDDVLLQYLHGSLAKGLMYI